MRYLYDSLEHYFMGVSERFKVSKINLKYWIQYAQNYWDLYLELPRI